MDLLIVIKVLIGEYYLWKCDVHSDVCGPKCGEILLHANLRYILIIVGLNPQRTRRFQKQP